MQIQAKLVILVYQTAYNAQLETLAILVKQIIIFLMEKAVKAHVHLAMLASMVFVNPVLLIPIAEHAAQLMSRNV